MGLLEHESTFFSQKHKSCVNLWTNIEFFGPTTGFWQNWTLFENDEKTAEKYQIDQNKQIGTADDFFTKYGQMRKISWKMTKTRKNMLFEHQTDFL